MPFVLKCLRAAAKVVVEGDIPAPSGFMTPVVDKGKRAVQLNCISFARKTTGILELEGEILSAAGFSVTGGHSLPGGYWVTS